MLRRLLIFSTPLMALTAMLFLRSDARAAETAAQPPVGSARDLAAALMNANPPAGTVALAVDAANVELPTGTHPPPLGASSGRS
ncbi:MAG: hypothetical protein LC772_08210 [Chloroflexi bacterium]|nr:hypothetical protein [Chloroflexota bacterium]